MLEKNKVKQGEYIRGEIFTKAYDTTVKPIILINNKAILENNTYGGVFKIKTNKKGKFLIKGKYITISNNFYQHFTTLDTFLFEVEYIVE